MKDKVGKDAKPTEAQDKRGRGIDEEMRACRRKLGDAGGPAPAPAGDIPTPTEVSPKP
jgi:hypothetical protein